MPSEQSAEGGDLPPYRLNVTKSRSGTGPTQYPSHDRVIVEITVPSTPYPDDYAFPFTREMCVATALEDGHIYHQILREHGIEPDPDANGVWDATVSTFEEAGVGRGDGTDSITEGGDDV